MKGRFIVSETPSANGSSIPAGTLSVKPGLSGDLSDLPVKNCEISLVLVSTISGEQLDAAATRIFAYQRRAIVETNFKLGDLWNQSTLPEYAEARRVWLSAVKGRLTVEEYERFEYHMRRCGWVGRKWHPMRRNLKCTWSHFVKHKPGVGGKPDEKVEKPVGELREVSCEIVDGIEVVRVETPGGVPWILRRVVKP